VLTAVGNGCRSTIWMRSASPQSFGVTSDEPGHDCLAGPLFVGDHEVQPGQDKRLSQRLPLVGVNPSPNLTDPIHQVPGHSLSARFAESPVGRHQSAAVPGCHCEVEAVVDGHIVSDG